MNLRYIASLILLAVAMYGLPPAKKTPQPSDSAIPSDKMRLVMAPILRVVSQMSIVDRLWLREIYLNTAIVVESDAVTTDPICVTTRGARALHVAVLNFVWKGLAGNAPGKYPRLGDAIDHAFETTVGDTERVLTPELRESLVELYRSIAWAGLGEG